MLRIQLAHSYFLRFDPKQWERGKPYPPLATLQVAAMLRRMGHAVALFDAMLAEGTDGFAATLRPRAPDLVVLYEDNFNFLTKMCLDRMHEAACEVVAAARAAGARVLVAGSDASDRPQALLAAGAHGVLCGEGVGALCELVERLQRDPGLAPGDWLSGVPGVVREGSADAQHADALPPDPRLSGEAAWDLVDMDRYRRMWLERHGYFSLNMVASRGCPFRCNWCAKPIWGNHYRQRPAAEVAAEMAWLKRSFAPDHVWMADDIFGFRVDWLREFGSQLDALDARVPFTIQIRANMISAKMADALQAAGCVEAWIGAESGSQRILDAMCKDTRVEDLVSARERLGARGIRVGFFIQLGYLGEQLEDLLATRELVARAAPDEVGVSVSYPLPGTRFYEQVKAQLGEKTHWEDSGDLAMMFRGAYDSDFYRSFRDLLHRQVELQGQWNALLASEREHRSAAPTAARAGRRRIQERARVAAAQDC